MSPYTSWLLASPFIPVTVTIYTPFYNYNVFFPGRRPRPEVRDGQRWSGQVRCCSIFSGTFGTSFINCVLSDAGVRECSIEDYRSTFSTLAATLDVE